MAKCDTCKANKVCDHNKYGFENCGNYIPSDVVEVVRCRDCEWWAKQNDSAQGGCALLGIYPTGAWYCGNGRKRR